MKFYLIFLLYASTFLKISCDNTTELCKICNCINVTNVVCSNDISTYIFEPNNTQSYAKIQQLKIEKNELNIMNKKIYMENLLELDLSGNGIHRISSNIFSQLQQLVTLNLSSNHLEDLQPNAFQGEYVGDNLYPLRSLRKLYLDHNNLQSLNENLFLHTERIEVLSLAFNPFKVIDTKTVLSITNLVYLMVLDLSYTQINKLPADILHTPKYMKLLDLSGNNFIEIPNELKEAQSLENLIINNNPLKNLTKQNGFPVIPSIKVLKMCKMSELTTIEKGSIANLKNLEELYITDNLKLTRIDDGALAISDEQGTYTVWPNIKKFHINDNHISYINKSLLANWDNLAELNIINNPWTCECENQWMVETLIPIYLKIDEEKGKQLKCAAPVEMDSYTFYQLYEKNYKMRCLDYYGAQPEKDAALLVGMLAGVLLGVPIVLFIIYSYKRHWFGIFDDSPAAFSRQFYSKTNDVYEY